MSRHRRCIEFAQCDERERVRITAEPDFVRIYYDPPGAKDLHLISVKNVLFSVLRTRRNATPGLAADLDVRVSDNLDALMGLEDVLREDVQAFISNDNNGRFPSGGIENRMLLHRIHTSAPHATPQIITRLRFLGGRLGDIVAELKEGESAVANIALMGMKISRGEIFPVWRVTRMTVIAATQEAEGATTRDGEANEQSLQPDSEPDDEDEPDQPPDQPSDQPSDQPCPDNADIESDTYALDADADAIDDACVADAIEDGGAADALDDADEAGQSGGVPTSYEIKLRRFRDELVSEIDAKFDGLFHASGVRSRS